MTRRAHNDCLRVTELTCGPTDRVDKVRLSSYLFGLGKLLPAKGNS